MRFLSGSSLLLTAALTLAAFGPAAACSASDPGAAAPDGSAPDVAVNAAEAGSDAAVPSLCEGAKPADWPPGPYAIADTKVLPRGMTFDGPSGTVKLDDYFEPCAARSRLLVIRTGAAWCGPYLWHASHTTRLLGDARFAGRLRLLDLVVADEDNMPATVASAARLAHRIDVPAGLDAKLAIDAKYTFSTVLPEKAPLPEYVLVDTRTMKVVSVIANPDPDSLLGSFAVTLAALDGAAPPKLAGPVLHDGVFTDDQWDLLHDMTVPAAPPADPTNEFADLPAAAAFGQKLFSDTGLSPSGTVSCATCHDPNNGFADGLPQSVGVAVGDRNAPSILLAAHARWMFWDGRADTLWMQALGPFENPKEFGSSRLFVAQQVATRYAADYAAVFGAKYPLPDLSLLPPSGKPGDAAYDALSQDTRDAVTRVYVDVGKAIAAFERTFRAAPNELDHYVGGDPNVLGPTQRRALSEFFKVGCAQCHWGPRLTDDAFHVLRFPTGRQDGLADPGRSAVLLGLASSELVATSRWSDSPSSAKPLSFTTVPPSMVGAFKTPSLRGVSKSAPYGHGGGLQRLSDVAVHYGMRGAEVPAPSASGTVEEWVPWFQTDVQSDLPQLLDLFTAESAVPMP